MSYQDNKNNPKQQPPGSTTNKPREGGLDKDKFQDKSRQQGGGGQGTQSK